MEKNSHLIVKSLLEMINYHWPFVNTAHHNQHSINWQIAPCDFVFLKVFVSFIDYCTKQLMKRYLIFAVVLILFDARLLAYGPQVKGSMEYRVSMPNPHTHYFEVEILLKITMKIMQILKCLSGPRDHTLSGSMLETSKDFLLQAGMGKYWIFIK